MPDTNKINWIACSIFGGETRRSYIKLGDIYILHYTGAKSYYIGNRPTIENGQLFHLYTSFKGTGDTHEHISEWRGRDCESISETELNLMLLKYLGQHL
jgi:hypothetical protein